MLLSSGDNFPHLIQKRRSQLGFVTYLLNYPRSNFRPIISVAMQYKVLVCGRWIAGIVGSNPAEGMDVRPLAVLCVVQVENCARSRSLLQNLCFSNCA